jgi:hypothetical protein
MVEAESPAAASPTEAASQPAPAAAEPATTDEACETIDTWNSAGRKMRKNPA